MRNILYLIPILLLSCATKRNVEKNVDIQKKDSTSVVKETSQVRDSASVKSTARVIDTSFDIEPVNGTEARFVYIKGKDSVVIKTTGRVRVNNSDKTKTVDSVAVKVKDETKDNKITLQSSSKTKDTKIEKENNAFQFILIGMGLLLALQFGWRFIKDKYFI